MNRSLLYCILSLTIITSSCDELFVPKLEGETINIISPADSAIVSNNQQLFFWETSLEDTPCRLQIATPSFNKIERLLVDTLIENTQFTFTLYPAEYEWRIRLENSAYSEAYYYRKLYVDSASDLSNQTIEIVSPADQIIYADSDDVTYSWTPHYLALEYRYLVNNLSTQNTIDGLTEDTLVILPAEEGYYEFNLRAQATYSNSPYSTHHFWIDYSSPQIPSIITPTQNQILTDPSVYFQWSNPVDPITDEFDSIYFFGNQSTTQVLSAHSATSSSFDSTFVPGIYYWEIKRFDVAGHESTNSDRQRFIIQ